VAGLMGTTNLIKIFSTVEDAHRWLIGFTP
jgi:hypothetical protein